LLFLSSLPPLCCSLGSALTGCRADLFGCTIHILIATDGLRLGRLSLMRTALVGLMVRLSHQGTPAQRQGERQRWNNAA
jgi:hypothetical protein